MLNKFTSLITVCAILSACQQAAQTPVQSASLQDGDYCYRNAFTNSDTTDVEELFFTLNGATVEGEYNWLPQFKDQRKGTFEGTVSDQMINASYTFNQEGQSRSEDITITITDNDATVEGGAPGLGLNRTLNKVDC